MASVDFGSIIVSILGVFAEFAAGANTFWLAILKYLPPITQTFALPLIFNLLLVFAKSMRGKARWGLVGAYIMLMLGYVMWRLDQFGVSLAGYEIMRDSGGTADSTTAVVVFVAFVVMIGAMIVAFVVSKWWSAAKKWSWMLNAGIVFGVFIAEYFFTPWGIAQSFILGAISWLIVITLILVWTLLAIDRESAVQAR